MIRVAVFGGSGFVGHYVVRALQSRGADVLVVTAPRLSTAARCLPEALAALEQAETRAVVDELSEVLIGCSVVINAAGVADATGGGDVLYGADALLPGVVALASPSGARVIQVSSAAVQGRRRTLDESEEHAPFSDYSAAKALGERVVWSVRSSAVAFRPTSVQGRERHVTMQLIRIASSRISSVAGRGDRPTPQVLVGNVADAIAHVALDIREPPSVVLQPGEGLTTASLLTLLGGRTPLKVPTAVARAVVGIAFLVGRRSSKISGVARRVEMLWFGQDQEPGWLAEGWTPPLGVEAWKGMA